MTEDDEEPKNGSTIRDQREGIISGEKEEGEAPTGATSGDVEEERAQDHVTTKKKTKIGDTSIIPTPPALPFKLRDISATSPVRLVNNLVRNAMSEETTELELESPLKEDIFSLLYLSDDFSIGFLYSFLIFAVQMFIIILILLDLIDASSAENPLKVPPGVTSEVTIAQGISMVLAAATQTNLLTSLSRMALAPSYDHEYVASIYPYATKTTYIGSFVLQFIAGLSMLTVNFILNMQSTSVLSLMLNFAALAFISEIQETAFWVAKNGYISKFLKEATLKVVNFHIPRQQRRRKNNVIKRIAYVVIQTLLLIFYGIIVKQQKSGVFLCNKLLVQFGDEFRPDMAYFSDQYLRTGELVSNRATYVDAKSGTSRFAYCAEEQAWTFSGPFDLVTARVFNGDLIVPSSVNDPCIYWMKSRKTTTYDITDTLSQSWLVQDYFTNNSVPIDYFFLGCNDCEGNHASHSCSGHGLCIENTCECSDDRVGVNCEHIAPCNTLELDQRTEPFPYASGGTFVPATSYELLLNNQSRPVLIYNKPVYVAYLSPTKIPLNVLIFTGRRYGLFLNFELYDANEIEQLRVGLPSYLPKFHGWLSKYRAHFFSESMDFGKPSDWSSPVELKWYRARELLGYKSRSLYRVDINQPTNTILICPKCQIAFNDCLNNGNCVLDNEIPDGNLIDLLTQDGVCDCKYGFEGHLCEKELDCFSSNVTCLNGGNCTVDGSCSCTRQYAGKLCQYELADYQVEMISP